MESVELLVQIVVEDSGSAFASGLEKDAAAWVRDRVQTDTHKHTHTHWYSRRAPTDQVIIR